MMDLAKITVTDRNQFDLTPRAPWCARLRFCIVGLLALAALYLLSPTQGSSLTRNPGLRDGIPLGFSFPDSWSLVFIHG